jgi:hypothetical protein
MSLARRTTNPGRREREARKRHGRARVYAGAETEPLKLGRKHFRRWVGRLLTEDRAKQSCLTVADTETSQGSVR